MAVPTKADEIALVLEQAILSGELSPGQILRQEQLSAEFAVSRTPIREALRQLTALGLVVVTSNRSASVRRISGDDLRESFILRAALEGFAAELARERLTIAQLHELGQAERRFAKLTRALRSFETGTLKARSLTADWVYANEAFHDVFLSAAGVTRLTEAARNARRVFQGQAVWSPNAELSDLYSERRATSSDRGGVRSS